MTGSALRRGTLWLNMIVSTGRRVWKEGGGKFPPAGEMGDDVEFGRFFQGIIQFS